MIYGIIGFLIGALLLFIISFILPRERIRQHNSLLDEEEANLKQEILSIQHNVDLENEKFKLVKLNNEKDVSILNLQKEGLEKEIDTLKETTATLSESYYNEKIAEANERITKALDAMEINLEREAKSKQEAHLIALEALRQEYSSLREDATQNLSNTIKTARQELDELNIAIKFLKSCVDAATAERQRNYLEAHAQDFYRVMITREDIAEIEAIRSIEGRLRNAEVINKVIWTYYYRTPANDMINRVLGADQKTGIYKITNINDGMIYVGQAVDVKSRWTQHIKRGIGAESGGRVKLYPAMYEQGVENFTFELLEECSAEELNDKEKYWIDFYNGVEYGYNMKV